MSHPLHHRVWGLRRAGRGALLLRSLLLGGFALPLLTVPAAAQTEPEAKPVPAIQPAPTTPAELAVPPEPTVPPEPATQPAPEPPATPYSPKRRWLPWPMLRPMLGPAWALGSPEPTGVALNFDLTVGAMVVVTRLSSLGSAPILEPLLGYGYKRDRGPAHLFVAGLGFGYGGVLAAVRYVPRLLVGSGAVGLRHGIIIGGLLDMLAVEVSHDLISQQGVITHELRLMFGINPVSLLAGVAALAYVK
jgi:hypothetical protein